MSVEEMEMPGTLLVSGVVGSTAYGLARPGSDIDRLGIYAAPTEDLLRLLPPIDGYRASPDAMYHEARKAVQLLLKANPAITEILWLSEYETRHRLGDELIALRKSLLCAGQVRNSYLDYARDQFRRLKNRGDGSFSSDTRKRTAKHARHIWRLIAQGTDLNATGRLTVRLSPVEARMCREFGDRVAGGDLETAQALIASAERHFDEYGGARSALPMEPDQQAAEDWLLRVRREFY